MEAGEVLSRQLLAPILLLAAAVCLGLGLTLPIVEAQSFLLISRRYSIVDGILLLIDGGDLVIAAVVAFFSMTLPVAKLVLLAAIWKATWSGSREHRVLTYLLERTSKWAMLDVLVVALIVFSFKANDFTDASAGNAALPFIGAIALTALASFVIVRQSRRARLTEAGDTGSA